MEINRLSSKKFWLGLIADDSPAESDEESAHTRHAIVWDCPDPPVQASVPHVEIRLDAEMESTNELSSLFEQV